jgi:hypothetical protein
MKAAEVQWHKKQQLFKTINVSANTVADRMTHSVASDRSTDVTDIAQLAVFI